MDLNDHDWFIIWMALGHAWLSPPHFPKNHVGYKLWQALSERAGELHRTMCSDSPLAEAIKAHNEAFMAGSRKTP